MVEMLLFTLAVTLSSMGMSSFSHAQLPAIPLTEPKTVTPVNSFSSYVFSLSSPSIASFYPLYPFLILWKRLPILGEQHNLNALAFLLQNSGLTPGVIDKVLTIMSCVQELNIPNIQDNHTLTVIDYSLPSNQKRLWIFDLVSHKLLFHTYVGHGIKSGGLQSTYFSNQYNSKSSSIGVYQTEKAYHGREGLSLRLTGLDVGFNDRADARSIVMHGGWYMDEAFIKKFGRPGRSWGCPVLPLSLTDSIINTIKDKSLLIIYYPRDDWFFKSKFFNCLNLHAKNQVTINAQLQSSLQSETKDPILFTDLNNDNQYQEIEPVLVINANSYRNFFTTHLPVERMLRRTIENEEYIVLTPEELRTLVQFQREMLPPIYFVLPNVKMRRGYYITEMKLINFGTINSIFGVQQSPPEFLIEFANHITRKIKSTNQFIRWIGL